MIYSVDKAKALLDEMGPEAGSGRQARHAGAISISPVSEANTRAAEFLRQSLGRVGIDLQLQTTDIAGWAQKFADWD